MNQRETYPLSTRGSALYAPPAAAPVDGPTRVDWRREREPASELFDPTETPTRIMDLPPACPATLDLAPAAGDRHVPNPMDLPADDTPAPSSTVVVVREPGFPLPTVLAAFAVGCLLTAAAIMLEYAVMTR